MSKNLFFTVLLFALFLQVLSAGEPDADRDYAVSIGSEWSFKVVSLEHLYPTYLADPLGVRAETSSQSMLYSDYDFQDPVNDDGSYTGHFSIYAGVRLSVLQFTNLVSGFGVEGEIGYMPAVYMRRGNNDLIGTDGIYYFRINSRVTPWLNMNFSKHHICTHLGDEFAVGVVSSPVDYDPNRMQLPVLDDFRLAAVVQPLYFLGKPEMNFLSLYGEIAWFDPGVDFLGKRQNKPDAWAYMNYLAGVELEYYFSGWGKHIGGVYAAANLSAYEQNGFAPNLSVYAGWIFPQDWNKQRLRTGIQYYNGRSLLNQFYNRKEKFWAIFLAFDT